MNKHVSIDWLFFSFKAYTFIVCLSCTDMHWHALSCTDMHWHALSSTVMHIHGYLWWKLMQNMQNLPFFDIFGCILEKPPTTDFLNPIFVICLVSYNFYMIPHVWASTFELNMSRAWGEQVPLGLHILQKLKMVKWHWLKNYFFSFYRNWRKQERVEK